MAPTAAFVAAFVRAATVTGLEGKTETTDNDVDWDLDSVTVEDIDAVEDVYKTDRRANILVLLRAIVALAPAATFVAAFVRAAVIARLDGETKTTDNNVDRDLNGIAIENVDAVEQVQQTDRGAGILVLLGAIAALTPTATFIAALV